MKNYLSFWAASLKRRTAFSLPKSDTVSKNPGETLRPVTATRAG